ncbi:MAG: hypothetical protein WBA00_07930 [Rhodococcus sp. (in: high G+C Gram-positive bacteria)]
MRLRNTMITTTAAIVGLLVAATVVVAMPASAAPAPPCRASLLMVHDIASSPREWDGWLDDARSRGWCPVVAEFGATPLSDALRPVAVVDGLDSLERSAAQIRDLIERTRERTGEAKIAVLGRGAGSLAAAYAAHAYPSASSSISTIVTVGPMWNGTDIGGLGKVAAFNRSIGVYDALSRVEKPFAEPTCSACGQIVSGSEFLTDLADRGPVPGVRYVDVVTATDGLVTDPLSATALGSDRVVLQSVDPASTVDHFHLPYDASTRRIALDSLR